MEGIIKSFERFRDEKFEGKSPINIQEFSLKQPTKERSLELVLIDCNKEICTKHFTVTFGIADLINRKTKHISFGTTAIDGRKFGVAIRWI